MRLNSFLAIFLIVAFTSCAKTPTQVVHPQGKRNSRAIALEEKLKQRDLAIQTLHGYAKVLIDDNIDDKETDIAVVIKRPNQFRIEAMDTLADVWAIIGLNRSKVWLHLPQKNKSYKKKAKKKYLEKYLAADIDFPDLTSIITGVIPNSKDIKLVELNKRNKHYRAFSKPIHIYYEKKGRYPKKLIKYSFQVDASQEENGQIEYEVQYSNWIRINKIYFPKTISIIFPKLASELTINYQIIELNKPADQKLFNSL